jgi:hypothetical protein
MRERKEWPQMLFRADGERRVFASMPEGGGWMTVESLRSLDHDGDGRMGGGPVPAKVPIEDVKAHLAALGVKHHHKLGEAKLRALLDANRPQPEIDA